MARLCEGSMQELRRVQEKTKIYVNVLLLFGVLLQRPQHQINVLEFSNCSSVECKLLRRFAHCSLGVQFGPACSCKQ